MDFVRYREFEFAFDAMARHVSSPLRVLDVGSPKLLPLTLAYCGPRCVVYAADILESEVRWVGMAAATLGISNLFAHVQDARALGYPDEHFDMVTSTSAFEHIAPERDGEIPAARELGRVLTAGGIAILTVPFARSYFAEDRVGRVYERSSSNEEPIFFQRFYDRNLLMKNIIRASGLELISLGFIEERFFFQDPRRRLAHYINSSRRQNVIFGPWYPALARVFLSAPLPLEQCRKPYIACLVMRKPVADSPSRSAGQ